MRQEINFTVYGEPKAKARHRTGRTKDGRMIQYPDPKSKKNMDDFLTIAMQHKPPKPLDVPVHLNVIAYMQIPQSWSNKKKGLALRGLIRPTKKPDMDNLLKFIGDSLNGRFWVDDKFIVLASISKVYSDRPRWEIRIVWNDSLGLAPLFQREADGIKNEVRPCRG